MCGWYGRYGIDISLFVDRYDTYISIKYMLGYTKCVVDIKNSNRRHLSLKFVQKRKNFKRIIMYLSSYKHNVLNMGTAQCAVPMFRNVFASKGIVPFN